MKGGFAGSGVGAEMSQGGAEAREGVERALTLRRATDASRIVAT